MDIDSSYRLDKLAQAAAAGLPTMVDVVDGLVCTKRVPVPGGYENRGKSALYTAMAIIGAVAELGTAGLALFPEPGRTLRSLRDAISRTSDRGLAAAGLWALSACGEDVTREIDRMRAVRAGQASSMELGLALAATASAARSSDIIAHTVRKVATEMCTELETRFSRSAGLFRATAPTLTRGHLVYRGVTSFASQVYPLYGIAEYVRTFGMDVPTCVEAVARHLIEVQGPLGQWWWLYSDRSGIVLDGYPVYTVHQDAMAFMALLPVQQLGVGSYKASLDRGLAWVEGKNELATPMYDAQGHIYRAVQRRGSDPDGPWGLRPRDRWRALAAGRHFVRPVGADAAPSSLERLTECRPYHLGWILLARSIARQLSRSRVQGI